MIRATVLLGLLGTATAVAAEPGADSEQAATDPAEAYRDQRVLLYHTGPNMLWGGMLGDGTPMDVVDFAERVGDSETAELAERRRRPRRRLASGLLLGGAGAIVAGLGTSVVRVDTSLEHADAPTVSRDQFPEAWFAWEEYDESVRIEEARRVRLNTAVRNTGLTVASLGAVVVLSGTFVRWRVKNGRGSYDRFYGKDQALDLVADYNAALAADLGLTPAQRATLDAEFPWLAPMMKPLRPEPTAD